MNYFKVCEQVKTGVANDFYEIQYITEVRQRGAGAGKGNRFYYSTFIYIAPFIQGSLSISTNSFRRCGLDRLHFSPQSKSLQVKSPSNFYSKITLRISRTNSQLFFLQKIALEGFPLSKILKFVKGKVIRRCTSSSHDFQQSAQIYEWERKQYLKMP